MNFQTTPTSVPLRVVIVNPLVPAAQLTIVKILSGTVFGCTQLIDLILLVYYNEKPSAEKFKIELIGCAFCCYNSIEVTSDLPNLSDADVFCFMTNFPNPNKIDFKGITSDEQFDTVYLIMKVANNLMSSLTVELPTGVPVEKKKQKRIPLKPIIVTDGLAAIDILMCTAKNIPSDVCFCPAPIENLSKCTLADYLKVPSQIINKIHVWGANDDVFHVEIERPLQINDNVPDESHCDKEVISRERMESVKLDHTQLSASWMKKEFIEKVEQYSQKNSYGCVYKAAELAKALRLIWQARTAEDGGKMYGNLGIVSDGSLRTIKGCPYVLPLILTRDSWSVDTVYEHNTHVQHEIKRMNKTVKNQRDQLVPYCKKFLLENVINQSFIPVDEESESMFSCTSVNTTINKSQI